MPVIVKRNISHVHCTSKSVLLTACCVGGQTHTGRIWWAPRSVSSWHHAHAGRPLTHSLCLRSLCAFTRWMHVFQRIESWVNHCITPQTRMPTHTFKCVPGPVVQIGEHIPVKATVLFLPLYLALTHIHTNHVKPWLQLESLFLVICPALWTCQMCLLIHFAICGKR